MNVIEQFEEKMNYRRFRDSRMASIAYKIYRLYEKIFKFPKPIKYG